MAKNGYWVACYKSVSNPATVVGSTLVSLIGAVLAYTQMERGVRLSFGITFLAGTVGVFAMIAGAVTLARESRFSFRILREENKFISEQIRRCVARLSVTTPAK